MDEPIEMPVSCLNVKRLKDLQPGEQGRFDKRSLHIAPDRKAWLDPLAIPIRTPMGGKPKLPEGCTETLIMERRTGGYILNSREIILKALEWEPAVLPELPPGEIWMPVIGIEDLKT